ncbi:unnamed protein product [Hymenolepis diminuta]|uniref:Clathrin_bdg domain-containing protein n=1 Tax=Hymenolepis diminuta TaxID=6216 RepID=A0A0R3SCB8_HYMDI|nr:unnamed protein product [Hymenolepis diminuta]
MYQFKSPYFASNAGTPNNFTDVWDNFQSSSIINGLSEVKNSVNINSTVNSDDFDEFTSFSSSFISTNLNSNFENNFDLSQPCIPDNITLPASQQSPKSTKSAVGSVDEVHEIFIYVIIINQFSDFVAPQKPNSIANDHLNHYNVVNFANGDVFGSLSPTKTSKSPESFESLSSANTNDKELVVEPTSLIAQVQVQPATTAETTVDEDGFEDFQGCTFESLPPPTIPDEKPQKELLTDGWLKCLTECRNMLSESASVLSPLVSDSDINAFLSTPRGCDFIYGKWKLKYMLLNLISVVLRYVFLLFFLTCLDISDPQLHEIFKQIDQIWSDLEKFVKNQEHKVSAI